MHNRRHNWLGWTLGLICVIAIVAIFWMLIAQNADLQHRTERAENAVKELVVQNRGPQGPDGKPGRPPTKAEIAAAVEAYCAENNGCIGPQGPAGANGKDGASIQGPQGAPGQGVTRVVCEGTSIAFYSGPTFVGRVKMVCLG
jgi:hypothetical protein